MKNPIPFLRDKKLKSLCIVFLTIPCGRSATAFETNVTVTTVAGSAFIGYIDGVGSETMFNGPSALADKADGVFVYDSGNHRIRSVTTNGTVTTLFQNQRPVGLVTNEFSILPEDVPVHLASVRGEFFDRLFFSEKNKIYEASESGFTLVAELPVSELSLRGDISAMATDGQLVYASSLNRLYVVSNAVANAFAGSGDFSSIDGQGIFSSFQGPLAITIKDFNAFVSESQKIRMVQTSPPFAVSTFASGINSAASIAVDDDGSVVFTASFQICRVAQSGAVTVVAGASSSSSGFADGSGTVARFSLPNSLLIKSSEIWVADTRNHRIRKIAVERRTEEPVAALEIGFFPGVKITGIVGRSYRVEATPDLEQTNTWNALATFSLPKSPHRWFDEESPRKQRRYYRAVLLP